MGLDDALRELGPESGEDVHIKDLSERVRAIIAREEGKGKGEGSLARTVSKESDEAAAARHEFKRSSSIDEQEETEKV